MSINMCYFIQMIHPAKVFTTEEIQVYQYKWKNMYLNKKNWFECLKSSRAMTFFLFPVCAVLFWCVLSHLGSSSKCTPE